MGKSLFLEKRKRKSLWVDSEWVLQEKRMRRGIEVNSGKERIDSWREREREGGMQYIGRNEMGH